MTEAERSTDKMRVRESETKKGQTQPTRKERVGVMHAKRIKYNLTNDQVTLTSRSSLNDGLTTCCTGLVLHVKAWPIEWSL